MPEAWQNRQAQAGNLVICGMLDDHWPLNLPFGGQGRQFLPARQQRLWPRSAFRSKTPRAFIRTFAR